MLENHHHDCRNCNKVRFILLGIIVSHRVKAMETRSCHSKTLKINAFSLSIRDISRTLRKRWSIIQKHGILKVNITLFQFALVLLHN